MTRKKVNMKIGPENHNIRTCLRTVPRNATNNNFVDEPVSDDPVEVVVLDTSTNSLLPLSLRATARVVGDRTIYTFTQQ